MKKIMTAIDLQILRSSVDAIVVGWGKGLPDADPITPPPDGSNTWSTGVFSEHKAPVAARWFTNINRRPGKTNRHVCVFVTHDKTDAQVMNNWWAASIPENTGLSLRVPLVPKGDPNLNKNRDEMWRTIARQAAAVDPKALVCPGWEMNLPGWAWRVTPANLGAWRAAWTRAYDTMKAEAPNLVIGFNPNGGGDQTGVDIRKVMDGLPYDAAGPDQYDCWPGMTSAANTDQMFTRFGGLEWWQDWTLDAEVPLIVPEWGVSSGSQWAGHTGGDNPEYIKQMWDFCRRSPNLLMETYFNETASYLKSDLLHGQNPRAGVRHRELWSTLP